MHKNAGPSPRKEAEIQLGGDNIENMPLLFDRLCSDAYAPTIVVARGEFTVVHQKMHKFSRNA
jgi:hypothetical protein